LFLNLVGIKQNCCLTGGVTIFEGSMILVYVVIGKQTALQRVNWA